MLHTLVGAYSDKKSQVLSWLNALREEVKGPIYNSVDLRNSGFKVAAVDTNIFPAGFNNLCPNYSKETGTLFKMYIEKYYPKTKNILIFPEAHTKNKFYLENVAKLEEIIVGQGFKVKVSHEIDSQFNPDIVLTNNDFSAGIPSVLKDLKIPVLPNPNLGWFRRSKYGHYKHYEALIEKFADILGIDSWFFTPLTEKIENVDFQKKEGFEKMLSVTEKMLRQIQEKYDQYGIKETPYIFIKNDSGTYGMAIHHIEKPEEIMDMNRRTRNKLSIGKGKRPVTDVIIQEGVPTIERFKGLTGEPVIYLVGNRAAGGFFRLNAEEDRKGNLNKGEMKFTKLCFHEMFGYENNFPDCDLECLEDLYFKIAEIASIASGMEMLEIEKL